MRVQQEDDIGRDTTQVCPRVGQRLEQRNPSGDRLAKAGKGALNILEIEAAEAMAQRFPMPESVDIPAGALGTAPLRPESHRPAARYPQALARRNVPRPATHNRAAAIQPIAPGSVPR